MGERDYGGIAQLVEHLLCKQGVIGSSPFTSTTSEETCFVSLPPDGESYTSTGYFFLSPTKAENRFCGGPIKGWKRRGPIAQLVRAHD